VKKLIHVIVMTAAVAASGAAQDGPGKVLRAVYFPPARSAAVLDQEAEALIRGLPEMLATSIASLQPFTRADSADAARSVVTVDSSPAAAGKVSVRIRLLEAGAAKSETATEFNGRSLDFASFRAFIADAASRFAPFLGPVDEEADILKVATQQQLIRAARETDLLDQLDKRLEFTLWMSGLLRLLDSTGVGDTGRFAFGLDILPLIVEADWFFSKDLGLQFSFYFNDSNAFDFGHGSRHLAYGLFIFPGLGIVYRTLGEVSAEFAVTLSAGWIRVTAKSGDVVDENSVVVIPQGSSVWSRLSPRVRISPALVWSITPSVALKAGLGFDFIFPGMFSWYSSPLADLQFLSIGAAYRM
jgi:hypothetical protein